MAKILWLIKRLTAMSMPEVLWRLSQNKIQHLEKKKYGAKKIAVTSFVFNQSLSSLQPDSKKLHINFDNREFKLNSSIHLLAGFDYEKYKKSWNAGFQSKNTWPDTFSYNLEYKQRDDIGDARTNWELNRHYQFALLAKDYAASRDEKYLREFEELFYDWNENNAFLHGIAWTSVMEVAIRCSNWVYAFAFLSNTGVSNKLLEKLHIGIINMTEYIVKHYSRYSSANNHLIVEAYAIGQSGILYDYKPWIDLSTRLLTREFPLQNYNDGVNKELSLHYQSFYMEAVGLMMRLMEKNEIEVPKSWRDWLIKMSKYVADCIGEYGEVIVFGDNDEGKILDLQGGVIEYYQYVLGMMSVFLNKRYIDNVDNETLRWLFTEIELIKVGVKDKYISAQYCHYREGGNTIVRSKDRKVLIGIDHAALGFGSIAAHAHADALSFQMFVKGMPVFLDPGTYIYHCYIDSRNAYRNTENHNTVCIGGKNQSEMLGAFLWGKRAECQLNLYKDGVIEAEHNGYGQSVKRKYEFLKDELIITDTVFEDGVGTLIINPDAMVELHKCEAVIVIGDIKVMLTAPANISKKTVMVSFAYGIQKSSQALKYDVKGTALTRIRIGA